MSEFISLNDGINIEYIIQKITHLLQKHVEKNHTLNNYSLVISVKDTIEGKIDAIPKLQLK